MIKSFTVTNHLSQKLTVDLMNPEQSGFIIKSITGLGPVKADITQTEVVTADGSYYNSARANSRNIVLNLIFDEMYDTIENIRLKSYKYFPLKKKVNFLIETDKRIAETDGYIESNEPDIFSKQEGCQISIVCPDAWFRSGGPTGKQSINFNSVEPLFHFRFSNESLSEDLIEFGRKLNEPTKTIFYDGDTETGIVMKIYASGNVGDLTIRNSTTDEAMYFSSTKLASFTGHGIISGDVLEISTIKGQKYVHLIRNNVTTNVLNCLDLNSDWFQLAYVDNEFSISATSGGTNVDAVIEYNNLFMGV